MAAWPVVGRECPCYYSEYPALSMYQLVLLLRLPCVESAVGGQHAATESMLSYLF